MRLKYILMAWFAVFWLGGMAVGNPEILKPGPASINLPESVNESTWLGLFDIGEGYELRPCQVTVTPNQTQAQDPGNNIAVKGGDQPLFLVRGIEGLEQGRVPTVHDAFRTLSPGTDLVWGEEGAAYRLRVTGKLIMPQGTRMLIDYRLALDLEGREQVLYQKQHFTGDPIPDLIWAGDLDGDNQLDLLLNIDTGKGKALTLFLSSSADPGDLLKKAADIRIPA